MTNKIEGADHWISRSINDLRRDWNYGGKNWIEDYSLSVSHPHRKLILDVLEELSPFDSVLEVGCNAGPNLRLIKDKYPDVKVSGLDVNKDAIEEARKLVPEGLFSVSEATLIPFQDKAFDIILCDAVLIYLDDEEFKSFMKEVNRVAKRGLVFVEWFDESMQGVIKDFHWARNYEEILKSYSFKEVKKIKITNELWPTKSGNWARNGYIFIALAPFLTGVQN